MDEIYRRNEIDEIFSLGEVRPLEELYSIEDLALMIKELDHKVDIQKGYKKSRMEAINNEIKSLENKKDFLKKVIVSTLNAHGEKGITFPQSCKINTRKGRDKWVIDDKDALIELFEEKGEIDNVAQLKQEWKINKKDADKVFEDWEKSEELPDCVYREKGEESVSISYLEKINDDVPEVDAPSKDNGGIPKKADYDGLE